MAKAKKRIYSLLIILIVLSNIAFAQYDDPGSYEGRPIDPSKEGIEYHREGEVIVYPVGISSKEKDMMERFVKGDFSEEEMRRIAREKFGKEFDEMEFKKSMMEFEERMERKEAFSYENEGYQRYYYGPSYEGYSKEHMIFGMIFEHIGDEIDPRDIKQFCNEPEKIADMVITKLREKVGDLQNICKGIEEQESRCNDEIKKSCSKIGTAIVRDDATELEKLNAIAYSCPGNKDAIVEACKRRSKFHMEQRLEKLDEECGKRFDFEGNRLIQECEKFKQNQLCDKEKFIRRCMSGIKKEEDKSGKGEGFVSARWECYDGTVESRSDGLCRSYEHWSELSRKFCENRCSIETGKCGVNTFSVSDECKSERQICPYYPIPQCETGTALRSRTDSNGCVYYFCEKEATVCPRDVKQCPDGSYVPRTAPNCEFAACPNIQCSTDADCKKGICPDGSTYQQYSCSNNKCITINYFQDPCQAKCPEPVTPSCAAGTHLEKNVDEKGCVSYYCKQNECPQVSKPACNADEKLESYYNNRGCITSYQCITYQSACPEVTKPVCAEDQSLTTKYDDRACIIAYECVSITSSTSITGAAILSTYADFSRHCDNSWLEQQKMCLNGPQVCDKEAFIERCKEQERKHGNDLKIQIEKNCQTATIAEIKHADERCSRIDEDRKRCLERGSKRCEHMKGNAELCRELLTEERLRKFIVEEANKRCKFKDIVVGEEEVKRAEKVEIVLAVLNTATEDDIEKLKLFIDNLKEDLKLQDTTIYKGIIAPNSFGDIKLLPFVVNAKISTSVSSARSKEVKEGIVARQKAVDVASKLVSLRDSDVPNEYLYIIEDKASEVLNVSESLEKIEKKEAEKGFAYKVKLFLGFAKKAEQEEIKMLGDSKSKLKDTIETLTKLIEEVPSDVAKSVLKEQIDDLQEQQQDIDALISQKEKKAKGLFGLFG